MFYKTWKWIPSVRKGQLLYVKQYCGFHNGKLGSEHRTLSLNKGDIVMFLSLRQRDRLRRARHERRDYKMAVLYGENIWQTDILIVEGSFSGFDMLFRILQNDH